MNENFKEQHAASVARIASHAALGDDRPEIDMKAFIDAKFATGEGMLTFYKDTPDAVILLSIKQALAVGKPFTVIPA